MSCSSSSTDVTVHSQAECGPLVISYPLSRLSQSQVKRLRRRHFLVNPEEASSQVGTGEGVACQDLTHTPVISIARRLNRRRFPDSSDSDSGPNDGSDEEEGEGEGWGEGEEEEEEEDNKEGKEEDSCLSIEEELEVCVCCVCQGPLQG